MDVEGNFTFLDEDTKKRLSMEKLASHGRNSAASIITQMALQAVYED